MQDDWNTAGSTKPIQLNSNLSRMNPFVSIKKQVLSEQYYVYKCGDIVNTTTTTTQAHMVLWVDLKAPLIFSPGQGSMISSYLNHLPHHNSILRHDDRYYIQTCYTCILLMHCLLSQTGQQNSTRVPKTVQNEEGIRKSYSIIIITTIAK